MLDLFPSRTIALTVGKMFVARSIAILAALILVLQVLDLLSESDKILAAPGNGQAQLFTYISLRVPELIQRFLPFSVLLGTLLTLATLNQNSEVIAMKAGGLSAHQILAPLLLASLAIAGLSFAFNERVVARAAASLDRWQAVEYGPPPDETGERTNVWVRAGDDLVRVTRVTGRGDAVRLEDVRIFDRQGGNLVYTIAGTSARWTGRAWRLSDVRRFDVVRGTLERNRTVDVLPGVAPDQFTLDTVDAAGLDFRSLAAAIAELDAAGRPVGPLEAAYWHKLAGPLSTVLMPLLGAVAAFGLARSGRLFIRAVIGMALGFAYFVADNFGLAMGNLGAYPPLLAAWGPFLLFLAVGEAVLLRTEE